VPALNAANVAMMRRAGALYAMKRIPRDAAHSLAHVLNERNALVPRDTELIEACVVDDAVEQAEVLRKGGGVGRHRGPRAVRAARRGKHG
jgi:hypothetical protein